MTELWRWRALGVGLALALVLVMVGATAGEAGLTPGQRCEHATVRAVRRCVKTIRRTVGVCYAETGATCPEGVAKAVTGFNKLTKKILTNCPDRATIAAAGYAFEATPLEFIGRMREACTGAAEALAERTFGTPPGGRLLSASASQRECLLTAFDAAGRQTDTALKVYTGCVLRSRIGKKCDPLGVAAGTAAATAKTVGAITGECGGGLNSLIGLDASSYIHLATDAAACLSATALVDQRPLPLACAP